MTPTTAPDVELEFLSGGGPPLAAAADWLNRELGRDGTGVVVALPGQRAARHLRLRLARLAGNTWLPPQFVTAGQLTDELLELAGAPADRLVRTLAWRSALAGLPQTELLRLAARPPAPDDLAGWLRLAEEVRGLFGELAAEGLEFRDVAANGEFPVKGPGEQRRWEVLAHAQERMVAELAAAGQVDPHLSRLEAIRAGRAAEVARVVLVGVADTNELLRRALEVTKARVTALVFASDSDRHAFDELGRIRPAAWIERGVELPLANWHVVDGPDDQAARALAVAAEWAAEQSNEEPSDGDPADALRPSGALRSDELAIGVADADVVPHLQRRLAAVGAKGRDAAGSPFHMAPPARLLTAASAALDSRGFSEFQDLVRHPAVDDALRRTTGSDPVALLARYRREHLPDRMPERWVPDARPRAGLERLTAALDEFLGPLASDRPRPLGSWVPELRAFLLRAYDARGSGAPADGASAEGAGGDGRVTDRIALEALSAIGRALDSLESVPPNLAPATSAAQALRLLATASAAQPIKPPASEAGVPTVELLGWLELSLDDAPALVVTGFEEGRVPESQSGDAYLPNGLRRDLGLIDDERRLARDLYTTDLLLRTRRNVAFITGRRGRSGDPQLPSRIVFHTNDEGVLARVKCFLAAAERRPALAGAEVEPRRQLLRAPAPEAPGPESSGTTESDAELQATESTALVARPDRSEPCRVPDCFTVTAFKRYLESPYLFYLRDVLRLRTVDDRARELDGAAFGTLAHAVVEGLVREPLELDPKRLTALLEARLADCAAEAYGDSALPAVRLQVKQLALRLARFAEAEAAHRAAGWRIQHVELDVEKEIDVDGVPVRIQGRIDRVERNDDGRWAIWDVKTSETGLNPGNAHRGRDGEWRDLQLPLYALLAHPITGDALPELGYVNLSRSGDKKFGFQTVAKWGSAKDSALELEEGVGDAFEKAREIVRAVREGEFFELGNWKSYDPVLTELAGVELVGGDEDEHGESGEGAE